MAFIEEEVWDSFLQRKKQDTADTTPAPDSAWTQAAQSFTPTGMDGPAPEPPDWQQQLAEQMARRGPTPSTSSLSPSGLAGGTVTSAVPPVSPTPEPFGWQDQLAEQMARRGPTPSPPQAPSMNWADFIRPSQPSIPMPTMPMPSTRTLTSPVTPTPDPSHQVPDWAVNPAGTAFDWASRPQRALNQALAYPYENNLQTAGQGEAALDVLRGNAPGKWGSELLKVTQPNMPEPVRDVVGLASDITLDPLNWPPGAAIPQLGQLGVMAGKGAARLAGGIGQAAAPAIRQAARAVGEALPDMRQAIAAGEAGAVELPRLGEAADTRRFYHGTGAAFETPDIAKGDQDSLYGPGYYLTSEPKVASSYGKARGADPEDYRHWENELPSLREMVRDARTPEQRAFFEEQVRELERGLKEGPNVRAVDVPENMNLLDTAAPNVDDRALDAIYAALPQNQQVSFEISIRNASWAKPNRQIDGETVYNVLADVTNSKANANAALERAGFDGLQYPGGRHMPLLDEQGRAIEHSAVVVFPAGLPKIKNAISGTIGGSPPEVGGAVLGGLIYQDDPNLTPAENLARRAAFAGGGAALGNLGRRLGGNSRLGGTIEDASRPGKQPWEMTAEEFRNLDFPVPEGGSSKAPKTVFGWSHEAGDYETLYDLAQIGDEWRLNEALGKGWADNKPMLHLRSAVKGNRPITVYRASDVGDILPGSYVTESREYALSHAERSIPGGRAQIYEMQVTPDELMTYGDPHEFIYIPKSVEMGHRRALERALAEGKPVPPEVLADYPDLAAKAAPTSPTIEPPAQNILADAAPPPATIAEPPPTTPQPSRWRPKEAVETVAEQAAQEVVPSEPPTIAPTEAGIVPPIEPPAKLPPTPPEPPSLGPPLLPESSLPSVKPTSDILAAAYDPDVMRRLADRFDNPITRAIGQAMGLPKRDIFTEGLVVRESILSDWKSGVVGAMSKVRSQGDSAKLFSVDKEGMAAIGARKVALNDVLEYPDRYPLTAEQQQYARTIHQLYDDQLASLAAEGIDIKELGFEPGGHYVGRRVTGRLDAEGEIELATVRTGGPGRVGGKAGFEKGRSFETQAEAVKAGFRYMSPEEALNANLMAAGKKIADKRLVDFILPKIPYRTAVAPEELKVARDYARDKLAAWGKAKLVINRGYRGERVPPATVASVGKFFPDVSQKMIEAGITKSEVVPLRAPLQEAEKLLAAGKLQAQRDFYKARDAIAKSMESARAPRYGEGMVMTPAFQGKFFSEADAKKLREMMDLEQRSPIRGTAQSVAWVNALPRLLMTTFDMGPALIQGQINLFSHPIVWSKALGRSMQALVSEKGYQSFLATHADTIKNWSQDGAIFSPSEFTAAVGQGGILANVPVVSGAVKPFARSFESLLNATRIYGLEATGKLAKTDAERAQLAKFWNEMTGVVDTSKMGLSPTQREIETAVMFAPRYRRAVLTLMTDIAKGGLRGKEARDALGKATVFGLTGYLGVWALANRADPQNNPSPHLDPREGGKFLTVNIAGQNIGLGGAYYSTSRALLQMALAPAKTAEIAAKYAQGLLSPTVGTAVEAYQRPYQYNDALKLTRNVIAQNLTPIWAQAYLVDGQGGLGAAVGTAAEMTGARTFPNAVPKGTSTFKYPGPPSITGPRIPSAPQFVYPGARR